MKTKIKIIVIISIFICVITLIVLNNRLQKENNKFHTTTLKEYTRTDRYLKLTGFGVFFEKYDGEISTGEISTKLEEITTKYLPEMYIEVKDLNETEMKEYFDNHTFRIESCFGIEEFDEFRNLMNKLKATGINIEQWNSLSVVKESFINDSDISNYAYAEYEVDYDNEQKVTYSVYISKSKVERPLYIINISE